MIHEIKRNLSAGLVHAAYVQLVLNGLMGIFHISYTKLWGPASECLEVLLRNHTVAVWSDFVCYLDQCQLKSEKLDNHSENPNHNLSERPTGRFSPFKYISISSAHIMNWLSFPFQITFYIFFSCFNMLDSIYNM